VPDAALGRNALETNMAGSSKGVFTKRLWKKMKNG